MKYAAQSRRITKLEKELKTQLEMWRFKGIKIIEPGDLTDDADGDGWIYLVIKKFHND